MKAKILFSTCLLLLISCNSTTVYSKFDKDFDENRWQKSDSKKYEFAIDDETPLYNILFKFSHIYDYQSSKVPIIVSIQKPNGENEKLVVDISIKDKSGKELGDCAGDICDLSQIIQNKIKLQKGNYIVTITNNYNGNYLPNVLAIGFEVEKTK